MAYPYDRHGRNLYDREEDGVPYEEDDDAEREEQEYLDQVGPAWTLTPLNEDHWLLTFPDEQSLILSDLGPFTDPKNLHTGGLRLRPGEMITIAVEKPQKAEWE